MNLGLDREPERDATPIQQRLWYASRTPRAAWAAKYGLCRSDPRYLDATDVEVLEDLMVAMYREGALRRLDPKTAVNEAAAAHPELVQQVDDAVRSSLADGRLARQIGAMLTGKSSTTEKPPETTPKRIRGRARLRDVDVEPEGDGHG